MRPLFCATGGVSRSLVGKGAVFSTHPAAAVPSATFPATKRAAAATTHAARMFPGLSAACTDFVCRKRAMTHCAGRCVLQARPMHVHGHHWMRVRGGCSFAVAACEYDHIHILTGGVPHHAARCRWCLDEGSCVPTEYLHNCAAQTTCSDLADCEECVASSCFCEFVVSLRLGPGHGLWVRHASTPCAGTALRRRLASLQRTRALAMASKCPPATPRCVELSHCAICTWGRWAKRCQLSACHCSYTCCQLHHQVCLRWGFLVWVRYRYTHRVSARSHRRWLSDFPLRHCRWCDGACIPSGTEQGCDGTYDMPCADYVGCSDCTDAASACCG